MVVGGAAAVEGVEARFWVVGGDAAAAAAARAAQHWGVEGVAGLGRGSMRWCVVASEGARDHVVLMPGRRGRRSCLRDLRARQRGKALQERGRGLGGSAVLWRGVAVGGVEQSGGGVDFAGVGGGVGAGGGDGSAGRMRPWLWMGDGMGGKCFVLGIGF